MMEDWNNGIMKEWKDGRMEEWKDGLMEGWNDGRMEACPCLNEVLGLTAFDSSAKRLSTYTLFSIPDS
jgi:hypothetical protein